MHGVYVTDIYVCCQDEHIICLFFYAEKPVSGSFPCVCACDIKKLHVKILWYIYMNLEQVVHSGSFLAVYHEGSELCNIASGHPINSERRVLNNTEVKERIYICHLKKNYIILNLF